MASSRTLLLVMLSVATVYCAGAADRQQAECGSQAGGAMCLFGACCSRDGMCGRDEDHCGNGCQEEAGHCNKVEAASQQASVAEQAECGSQAGGAICLFGACCSKDGMCGRGDDYCGNGCQEEAGHCNKVEAAPAAPVVKCGPAAGGKKCRTWARRGQACCSRDGQCGLTHQFCGEGCQSLFGACYAQHNLQ